MFIPDESNYPQMNVNCNIVINQESRMRHRDFIQEPNQIEEITIELDRNLKEITKLVAKRKELIVLKKSRLQQQFKIHLDALNRGDKQITTELREVDRDLNNLLTNVQQNPRLRSTVNLMWNQSIANISKAENAKTVDFWNVNKKLESEIDVSLKKLKQLDANIESIVGELFNIGRSIDDTDEQIREILSRRYQNHIQKAEPYSLERQKLQDSLQLKYQQREKVKEDKVVVIKKLIELLDDLRTHREQRMKSLFQIEDTDMPVYSQFIEGLEKIVKTRESLGSNDHDDHKLEDAILQVEQKSDEVISNYLKKQGEANEILDELSRFFANKLRTVSLEKALIGEIIPESASKNLGQAIKKCREFRKILQLSSNEKSMVRQGLDKTKSTTSIFQQILKSVESQRARRKKLMQELNQLQQYYNGLQGTQQKKRQLTSQSQQILLKKKQLQKRLNQLASKADLQGYKKVTQQMDMFRADQQQINNKIGKMSENLMSGQSNVEQFVSVLNSEYNDILKEIVPQSWMKKHDLRKPENVLELNWYLRKTFERLSI